MLRVLVADNHAIVRAGILRLLVGDPRIKVLGEASDFSEAVTKAHNFRPDVLILDVHMPRGAGLMSSDVNGELTSSGAKVLGISFANDDDARSLANALGAAELLDKINLGKELIPAIIRLAAEVPPLLQANAATDAGAIQ